MTLRLRPHWLLAAVVTATLSVFLSSCGSQSPTSPSGNNPPPTSNGSDIFRDIVCGNGSSFAVMTDGTVYAWGGNSTGQLGIGSFENQTRPVLVRQLRDIVQVASGTHTLALDSTGRVFACGINDNGQLGTGDKQWQWYPVQISGPVDFISVAAGRYHSLGVTKSGQVYAWGKNYSGLLGLGHSDWQLVPAPVPGLNGNGGYVVAGDDVSFYKLANATGVSTNLYSWGMNGQGQLGRGDPTDPFTFGGVFGAADVTDLSSKFSHTLAVRNGAVIAWGAGSAGQLGSSLSVQKSPAGVPIYETVVAVAAGLANSLALTEDGQVYTWGNGDWHPRLVPGLHDIVKIAAGGNYGLALQRDGTLWAWGGNSVGNLGDGTTITRETPVKVLGLP